MIVVLASALPEWLLRGAAAAGKFFVAPHAVPSLGPQLLSRTVFARMKVGVAAALHYTGNDTTDYVITSICRWSRTRPWLLLAATNTTSRPSEATSRASRPGRGRGSVPGPATPPCPPPPRSSSSGRS